MSFEFDLSYIRFNEENGKGLVRIHAWNFYGKPCDFQIIYRTPGIVRAFPACMDLSVVSRKGQDNPGIVCLCTDCDSDRISVSPEPEAFRGSGSGWRDLLPGDLDDSDGHDSSLWWVFPVCTLP